MSDNPTGVKRVVMDASAVIAFVLLDEKHHGQAVALVGALVKGDVELCAPSIFAYECDSVIRRRVHLGTLSPEAAKEARELIVALGVEVSYDPAIGERAYAIATQYDQPRVYDAAYAAFAEARGLELWTEDERFYNAVSGALPFVKFVGNFK
jgi:predicted nucleic acid-binding protein